MKKFLTILTLLTTIWLAAGEKYSFMALGDIHFDGKEYHTTEPTQSRNITMWQNGTSRSVLTAAVRQLSADMPFVIQVGDFIQGDCDTYALQEKMFADGFAVVKSFFPNHKFLAVKGNHDVRTVKPGLHNEPAAKAFLPLIAKELNRKSVEGNYTVTQGKDLYIFFDSFVKARESAAFVEKALKDNTDSRYVFFISHLPVLPGSAADPAWLIPARSKIMKMLARRNAIVIAAHTHAPAFMQVETPHGTLTQIIVSSLGYAWKPQAKNEVEHPDFDAFAALIPPKRRNTPTVRELLDEIRKCKINAYEIYRPNSGFAIIDVDDQAVTVKYYCNESGKPWRVKTIKSIK